MQTTENHPKRRSVGGGAAPERALDPTRIPGSGAHEGRPRPGSTGRGAFPARARQTNGPSERIRGANRRVLFLLGELRAATTEVEREVIREWIDAARIERARAEEALVLAPRRSSKRGA